MAAFSKINSFTQYGHQLDEARDLGEDFLGSGV